MEAEASDKREIIPLLLGPWEESSWDREKVYALGSAIAMSARYPDVYEPETTLWHLGCGAGGKLTRLFWRGNYWHIEDFILMLADAEARSIFLQEHEEMVARDDVFLDLTKEKEAERLRSSMNEHLCAICAWSTEARDELFLFLVFLALSVDSRAERACFKYNNVIVDHKLIPPAPPAILSLRSGSGRLLEARVTERISSETFRRGLHMLCMTGITSTVLPDTAGLPSGMFAPHNHVACSDNQRTYAICDIPITRPQADVFADL